MFKILFTNFGGNLSDLQQLKDELKNNVQKWYWTSCVQKTITTQIFTN
jgi:hypothetical protein